MDPIFLSHDPTQIKLMEEECIVVDDNDKVIGHDSKKNCHLNENINKGLLHRAFSVFLFNKEGKLLLQQRSQEKITFARDWTNTCCSHPLYFPEELVEEEELGVRRAAQRKLEHELGIVASEVPLEAFQCVSRVHYKAPSNGTWGEHESMTLVINEKIYCTRGRKEKGDLIFMKSSEGEGVSENEGEGV